MWFRVDDKLWGSPKWTSLKPGPRALWVTAGAYSMDQLTDGFIPTHVLPLLGGREADAVALVKAELWEQDAGGFRFHDWSDYQPSRADVLGKRDAEAERKARWRAEKAERARQRVASGPRPVDVPDMSQRDKSVSPAVVPDVSQPCPALPDPTRPDPTTPKGVRTTKTRPAAAQPDTFDAWWQAYGRREARGAAVTAYVKALKAVDADTLLTLTRKWFAARPDMERQFIPLPASWLNAQRWTDDPPTTSTTGSTDRPPSSPWDRAPRAPHIGG